MSNDDRAWREYGARFRREALQKIIGSAACVSIYSGDGTDFDVQQATELGAMLLLDKPIVLVMTRGAVMPSRLARAADVVLEITDLDDPSFLERVQQAVSVVTEGET